MPLMHLKGLINRIAQNEVALPFNISINWEEFITFVMPTQDKRYARMRSAVQIKSQAYKLTKANNSRSTSTSSTYQLIYSKTLKRRNSQAHQLTNPKTHQLINAQNSRTHKLINSELTSSSTYKLKKTSTYQRTKLKIITFILQHHFNFHSILAKI